MSLMWLAASVGLGFCTLVRPPLGIGVLLATLPLFAHRAPSPWRLHFLLLVGATELAYVCRVKKPWQGLARTLRENPVLLLGASYVVASFLSLSSLPLFALIGKHVYVLRTLSLDALPAHFATTVNLPERSREYAVLSPFLTLQAFVFCLMVWREITRTPQAGFRFAAALIAGVLIWSAVGLAEFYGGLPLSRFRGIYAADFTAPGETPRLLSIAGNSGWFAQYLVFALPYVALLLVRQSARLLRLVVVGALVVLIEVVLVLTFQRGGWVASIAELCCLATASVIVTWRRSGRAAADSMIAVVRTLALIAVVVALVPSLLYVSVKTGLHPGGAAALADYSARFQSLTNSPERRPYASAAIDIGKLHPILGGGSESFALRYREQFLDPRGQYFDVQPKVDPTSAHNVYLQTFAGKGIVGLALLVAMCVCALWACTRTLLGSEGTDRLRLFYATTGGASIVGFLVYGLAQEVFYIHALQVLFFFSVGFAAAATHGVIRWPARVRRSLWIALLVLLLVHLGYEYVYPGPARLVRPIESETGLYGEERDENGVLFQWTSAKASIPVPDGASVFALRVRSRAPFEQVVTVLIGGVPCGTYTLEDHEWHRLRFLVEARRETRRVIQVEVRVAPTYESDGRTLGIMIAGAGFQ
jgi:O-antigen ligase